MKTLEIYRSEHTGHLHISVKEEGAGVHDWTMAGDNESLAEALQALNGHQYE